MFKVSVDLKSLIIGMLLCVPFFFIMGANFANDNLIEYKINTFVELDNLEAWVNDEIKKGWEPLGGVSISYVKYSDEQWGLKHSQAMVKK